jgi:hypothetical protein
MPCIYGIMVSIMWFHFLDVVSPIVRGIVKKRSQVTGNRSLVLVRDSLESKICSGDASEIPMG